MGRRATQQQVYNLNTIPSFMFSNPNIEGNKLTANELTTLSIALSETIIHGFSMNEAHLLVKAAGRARAKLKQGGDDTTPIGLCKALIMLPTTYYIYLLPELVLSSFSF